MSEHFRAKILECLPGLLVPWFLRAKRDLEWRNDPTPYRVWISEIMLQQTRVEAVKPYYDRFLAELPDVAALAAVDETRLLKLWEGLGYYRRARNLQAAAKKIMQDYGGVFPSDYESVRNLPGIGDYTAGAILSIAFGKPFPAVDGNVLRVVSRLVASREDIDSPKIRKELTAALAAVYPAGQCSEFTQSLMELGATVCLPNGAPLCTVCPLAGICLASQNGLTDEIPVRKTKAARPVKEFAVVVLRDATGRFAVRRRPETGLLAGLYEFPNLEGRPDETALKTAFHAVRIRKSGKAKHVFTHVEWDMTLYLAETGDPPDGFEWVSRDSLRSETAIPSAFKAALKLALDPDSFPGDKP
jgi:A/G-specific adenine glycosylase